MTGPIWDVWGSVSHRQYLIAMVYSEGTAHRLVKYFSGMYSNVKPILRGGELPRDALTGYEQ